LDEGLVAAEEAVTAGQQVALEPALALVLRQHLHHPTVGRETLVGRLSLSVPGTVRDGEDLSEPVRRRLVRAEEAERRGVHGDHVTKEAAEHTRRFARSCAWLLDVDRVVAVVRE